MMKKFALLAVVGLFFVADAAQAGVFRRSSGGGCQGGTCGGGSSPVQKYAAAPIPVPPPAIVERSAPTPAAPEIAAPATDPSESAPAIAAPATESTQRFARLRGLGRRR